MSNFTVQGVLQTLSTSLNAIIPFLVLIATFVFLWGVVRYITAGGDEQQLEQARSFIVYGIIGLATIIAVWGFVYVVIDFIFNTQTIPNIPGGNVVDTI
jgi:fumarate reductase subunit D